MNITIIQKGAALLAAGAFALAAGGCGTINELTGTTRPAADGPVTTLITDPSESTKRWRGQYEQDALATLDATAEANGTFWALAISGNSLGEAGWQINGEEFRTTNAGGNQTLARAARRKAARESVAAGLRRLVRTDTQGGSDVLGALAQAREVLCDAPEGRARVAVVLSDFAIRIADGVDLYQRPPRTEATRRELLAALEHDDEIPNLACGDEPIKVYLAGIGRISNRETAKAVIALWEQIIAATGAELVNSGSRLRLDGFPGVA